MTGHLVGQAIVQSTGEVLVDRLYLADTWWSRFRGLQFRQEFPVGGGLLLVPCRSIHTFWMRFSIDLVFLDREGIVVETRAGIRPWTVIAAAEKSTAAALELPVDSKLPETGDVLRLRTATADNLPLLAGQTMDNPSVDRALRLCAIQLHVG